MIATLPASNFWVLAGSSVSPTPMLKEPEITVTCSMVSCQCGGILVLGGNLSRAVKGSAVPILPSMMVIFDSAGIAGTSAHLKSEGVNIVWSAAYRCALACVG